MASTRPVGTVRRIFGNLAKLVGGKSVAGLLSLVYMAIAARTLGPTDYGILILVHGFTVTVGGLIGWPGWHAVVRYGSQAVEAGDDKRLARLLRFAASLEGAGAVVAILAAALLAPVIGPRLGWSATATAFAVPYSFAVLAAMRSTPAGYLQLMRRFDLLGLHNTVAPGLRLVGALVAMIGGFGLTGFLVAWLVSALGEFASLWIIGFVVARKRLAGTSLTGDLHGVTTENPGIWRFMVGANADITLSELAGRLAPLAVGWMLGPAAAGLFAIAQRATTVIGQMASILGQSAYSEFAKLAVGDETGDALRRALTRAIAIAFAATIPILVVVGLFSKEIAVLLGGAAFAAAADLMVWLVIARAILVAAPAASAALIAKGHPGLSVTANVIGNLGLFPLLPLLMWRFSLIGAGIHALIQAIVVVTLLFWFLWRRGDGAVTDDPSLAPIR